METILSNKKANFDYEILDKFEAGLKLLGNEVKSLKKGHGDLSGSYVKLFDGEAYLLGIKIDPYQHTNTESLANRERTVKLLLRKPELKKIHKYIQEKGLTLVPLSLYIKSSFLKVSVGVGKGKKKADKRETIKKRDIDRAVRRKEL